MKELLLWSYVVWILRTTFLYTITSEWRWLQFWRTIEWYQLQGNGDKLNDVGWKNSYFTSADASMLGYGWGMSQYPHFYDKYLDMYQVLPHTYIGYFDGFIGDKLI